MVPFLIVLSIIAGLSTPFIVVGGVKKHRRGVVLKTSQKRKKLVALNEKYNFKNPKTSWNYMHHCQNLNKFRAMDYSMLERDFFNTHYSEILNSLNLLNNNKKQYLEYSNCFDSILDSETIIPDDVKLKKEIYKKYENELIAGLKKRIETSLTIKMAYEYTSPAGRNHYESDPHYIKYDNISDETISSFSKKHDPRQIEEFGYKVVGGALIPTEEEKQRRHEEVMKRRAEEQARTHNFHVTLHIEISAMNKFVYYFIFFNRYNGRKFQYYDFQKTASENLVRKVNHLKRLLDDIYYLEDPERIVNTLELVKEAAIEAENFHLDMKPITVDMIKELDYKLNMSFCCDLDGNVCIERAQIGLADDINAYLEDNPNSIYVPTIDWVQKTLDSINQNSKNKVAALYSLIIDKSNDRCKFFFADYLNIKVDVDINTNDMIIIASPHYFYLKNEINRQLAKQMVFDKTLFLACDSFLSDVKKINEYYSSRFSTLIKKLIPLREQYKDNDKIAFNYSSIIIHSEEWMKYFNVRPKIEPIKLDELNEGKLVCNDKLSSVMRDYQKYAFNWANKLISNSFSGILADDMGLGKTLEMISVINADKTNLPNLIVCPVSLLHNWEHEFHKWCPQEKVVLRRSFSTKLFDNDSNFDSKINYIISYDFMIHHIEKLRKYRFNYIVLDEAQYIKNESTSRSRCSKLLVGNYRFALTGTPLENKEDDLLNIFDFVMPSLKEKYQLKYLSNQVKREYISPFLLRRRKTDVLSELPEKNTIIVELDMNDKQRSIYDTYKSTHSNENDQYLEILALLTKLRQICVSPKLVIPNSTVGSTKLDYMFELIDNIIDSNESVLIYSFFASAFDYIEPMMKERKIKYVRLDGSVSPDSRPALIDEFDNNDEIHCFLISLKAGGVGLNLTKANNVIFLDPWWNIAVENQAADRTHRIGQTKKVTIYRLVCKDTIEEKVLDIQKEKLDLINFFVESQGDDPLGKLTVDMMKELLK